MRKYTIPVSMEVEYLVSTSSTQRLGDHLGSTSLTTDSNGNKISEIRYKPWGETRYTWTDPALDTTPVYAMTRYQYTGQFSYEAEFGLYFYNARWYDSQLGRFAQADTIVPGVWNSQSWDRYAYTLNNPLRYTDPTGHWSESEIKKYLRKTYGKNWEAYYAAWQQDTIFWDMLLQAKDGDILVASTEGTLGPGRFMATEDGSFTFVGLNGEGLEQYQGNGPYMLINTDRTYTTHHNVPPGTPQSWHQGMIYKQPQFDYSSGVPVFTGRYRVVRISPNGEWDPQWTGGSGLPWAGTGGVGLLITAGKALGWKFVQGISGPWGWAMAVLGGAGWFSNSVLQYQVTVTVSYQPGLLGSPSPFPMPLPPRNPFNLPFVHER